MAHVNYHGWRTQNSQIYRDWRRIEAIMKHVRFDRSPFVPKTFEAYVKHRSEMALQMAEENQVKVKQNQIEEDIAEEHGRKYPLSAFGGKRIFNGRVGVMGSQTIWAYHWTPDPASPEAPWPNLDEYREEGDERHTSTFGRFLPIPRVPGNPTVVWKQKAFKVPYPHDQVNPVAKKYDIPLPNEYFNEFEPEYDIHGIPIDDPEDFGRTATVSRPSSTRRGSAVDVPVPQTAGSAGPRDFVLGRVPEKAKTRSTRSGTFPFNPVVPEFVSQRGGRMAGDDYRDRRSSGSSGNAGGNNARLRRETQGGVSLNSHPVSPSQQPIGSRRSTVPETPTMQPMGPGRRYTGTTSAGRPLASGRPVIRHRLPPSGPSRAHPGLGYHSDAYSGLGFEGATLDDTLEEEQVSNSEAQNPAPTVNQQYSIDDILAMNMGHTSHFLSDIER